MIQISTVFHGFKSLLHIICPDAFHVRIRNDRDCMIPDHTTRVVGGQLPNGQFSAMLILREKSLNKIYSPFRFDDRK